MVSSYKHQCSCIRLYYLIQVFNGDINDHNISIMTKPSCHLFFCFLTLFKIAMSCDAIVNTSRCSFNVTNSSLYCSKFQYISCTYLFCSEPNINGTCTAENRQIHYDCSTCLSNCCGVDNAAQKYFTLSHCQGSNQYASLMVGISIGGGIFILSVIIVTFCCCRKRITNCCENMRSRFRGQEVPRIVNPSASHLRVGPQPHQPQQNFGAWVVCSTEQYYQMNETICVICLAEKPTVKLPCRHMYHRTCIKIWVSKRRACPICQSCQFERTTIFCEKCNFKRRDRTFSIDELYNNCPRCCIECKESI